MYDIAISTISLLFFMSIQRQFDTCFITALLVNILHILTHFIILVPYSLKLIKLIINKQLDSETFTLLYIKVVTMLKPVIEVFSILILLLNLICLFSIVANVFEWRNYDYLFLVYCITNSTLSDVSYLLKIQHDTAFYYSNQVMKSFNLSIAFIFFAISSFTQGIYIDIYAIGFGYMLCRFKDSIPKNIVYCFFLFANTVYLLTCVAVGGLFYLFSQIKFQGNADEGNKSALLIFYIFLLCIQIGQIIKVMECKKEKGGQETRFNRDHWIQTGKLYTKIRKLANLADGTEGDDVCSICQLDRYSPDYRVTLACKHTYHLDCIVGWLPNSGAKKTCPLCRMTIYEEPWIQEYLR